MKVCIDCGKTFEDNETITVQENVGEFWGTPAYETYEACPYCKSTEIEDEEAEE